MIKILYNPENPELIFSIAVSLMKFKEKFCFIIPQEIGFLADISPPLIKFVDTMRLLSEEEAEDEADEQEQFMLSISQENENTKFILLGLHPRQKKDSEAIAYFIDKYEDRILLWVDNHEWPHDIWHFATKNSRQIFIDPEVSCLSILNTLDFPVPEDWLRSERAMINIDLRNDLAARYIKAMLVNKSAGKNYNMEDNYSFLMFVSAINEIITAEENPAISSFEGMFIDMISKTDKIKNELTDDHPIFKKAKQVGRPVGCAILEKPIPDYVNIEAVLDYGIQVFPWLCVIGFTFGDKYRLVFKSKKLPIYQIIESYGPIDLNFAGLLKLINNEIFRYQAKKFFSNKI